MLVNGTPLNGMYHHSPDPDSKLHPSDWFLVEVPDRSLGGLGARLRITQGEAREQHSKTREAAREAATSGRGMELGTCMLRAGW